MQKIGLLQKANLLLNERLAFFDFLQKNNFPNCAILQNKSNFYIIFQSFGFDGDTILRSFSSYDFWQGTLPIQNQIYNFDIGELNINQFFQFFSENQNEKINSLSIFKSKNSEILIFINENISKKILYDFEKLNLEKKITNKKKDFLSLNKNNLLHFTLNLNFCVENFIKSKKINNLYENDFSNAIKNEIFNRIFQKFHQDFFIEQTSQKIIFYALNNREVSFEQLKKQIFNLVENIIEDNAKNIIIEHS